MNPVPPSSPLFSGSPGQEGRFQSADSDVRAEDSRESGFVPMVSGNERGTKKPAVDDPGTELASRKVEKSELATTTVNRVQELGDHDTIVMICPLSYDYDDDDDDDYSPFTASMEKSLVKSYPAIAPIIESNYEYLGSGDEDAREVFMPGLLFNIFKEDPLQHQPLALWLEQQNPPLESLPLIRVEYGIYKAGFVRYKNDVMRGLCLDIDKDGYEHYQKKPRKFVSQFYDVLNDENKTDKSKVETLKALFGLEAGQTPLSDLMKNLDALVGQDFQEAQKRAMEAGMRP